MAELVISSSSSSSGSVFSHQPQQVSATIMLSGLFTFFTLKVFHPENLFQNIRTHTSDDFYAKAGCLGWLLKYALQNRYKGIVKV